VAQEVVQKVGEAAKSLSQSGEAGLAQFDKRESPSVRPKTPFLPAASLETFHPCDALSLLGEAKPTLPRLMFCETQSHPIALGS
jgi:hypothetical protein